MAAMNVGGAITPAMAHTGRVLFRPFALRKWLALGFVSLLAGSGGGGFHFNYGPDNSPRMSHVWQIAISWIEAHFALLMVGAAVLLVIGLMLSWLGSVLRFVYLNQITRDPYAIREPFGLMMHLGTSFFLWRLAFGLIVTLAVGILVGLPIGIVYMTHHIGDTAAVVVLGIWCVIVGLPLIIASSVVDLFARDFVATAMFVRDVRVMEGWRIVIPILRENAGQSALYVLLLIVITLVIGFGAVFVALAVGLASVIIAGLFALIGYGIYVAGGNSWTALLIGYGAVFGTVLLAALCYVMSCAIQPFDVFRRTFALVVIGQAEPSLATIPVMPPGRMPEGI